MAVDLAVQQALLQTPHTGGCACRLYSVPSVSPQPVHWSIKHSRASPLGSWWHYVQQALGCCGPCSGLSCRCSAAKLASECQIPEKSLHCLLCHNDSELLGMRWQILNPRSELACKCRLLQCWMPSALQAVVSQALARATSLSLPVLADQQRVRPAAVYAPHIPTSAAAQSGTTTPTLSTLCSQTRCDAPAGLCQASLTCSSQQPLQEPSSQLALSPLLLAHAMHYQTEQP
jgi:hypothetical protein